MTGLANTASRDESAEGRLHNLLFDVMSAARDQTPIAPIVPEFRTLFALTAKDLAQPTPRRFELMRAAFVLGASLAQDDPLRDKIVPLIKAHDLQTPPIESTDPIALSWRNNHVLLQAAMFCVWPGLDPSGAVRAQLVARFLAGQREDGLFETEVCRGASGLWYSNLSVMLLSTLALRVPGLVSTEVLIRSIAGLMQALAHPQMLWPDCRLNLYPHADHGPDPYALDRRFLTGYHRSRHYLAWVPLARQLVGPEIPMPRVPASDRFPLCSDFIGGFAEDVLRRTKSTT